MPWRRLLIRLAFFAQALLLLRLGLGLLAVDPHAAVPRLLWTLTAPLVAFADPPLGFGLDRPALGAVLFFGALGALGLALDRRHHRQDQDRSVEEGGDPDGLHLVREPEEEDHPGHGQGRP